MISVFSSQIAELNLFMNNRRLPEELKVSLTFLLFRSAMMWAAFL
jgi:hypothetical protein